MRIEEETNIEVDQSDDPTIQIHVDKKVVRGQVITWVAWNFMTADEITFIVKDKPETSDDDIHNQVYTLTGNKIDRADGVHGNVAIAATNAATAKAKVRRYKLIHRETARDVTVAAGKFIVRDT